MLKVFARAFPPLALVTLLTISSFTVILQVLPAQTTSKPAPSPFPKGSLPNIDSVTRESSGRFGNLQSVSVPSGVVYYVSVTITNSQSTPTPAPFQQMVPVDSSSFASYEAANLQNVEFFNGDGSIIPSWLESGASSGASDTLYWLKISNGIAASSSVTVYMGFAYTSSVLFDGITVGEAPTLTATYGQYDNGASVFTFYDDFKGTSISSSWNQCPPSVGLGSYSVNNGIYIGQTGVQTGTSFSPPYVLDAYLYANHTGSADYRVAEAGENICTTVASGIYIAGTGDHFDYDMNSGGGPGTVTSVPASIYQYYTYNEYFGTSTTSFYINYKTLIGSPNQAAPSHPIGLWNGVGGASSFTNWIRVRAYPPNNAMPSVTFSTNSALPLEITTGPTLPQAHFHDYYTFTLQAAGGMGPYTWSWPTVGGGFLTPVPMLILGTNGLISGFPTLMGTFSFTATVKDSAGASVTQSFSLKVTAGHPAEMVLTSVSLAKTSGISSGSFLVVATIVDDGGHPVAGAHVSFTLGNDMNSSSDLNPSTDTQGAADIIATASSTFSEAQDLVKAIVSAGLASQIVDRVKLPYQETISSCSSSSYLPASPLPSNCQKFPVYVNAAQPTGYQDLTNPCISPFSSSLADLYAKCDLSGHSQNGGILSFACEILTAVSCVGGLILLAAGCVETGGIMCLAIALLHPASLPTILSCLELLGDAIGQGALSSALSLGQGLHETLLPLHVTLSGASNIFCGLIGLASAGNNGGFVSTPDGGAQFIVPSGVIPNGSIPLTITGIDPSLATDPLPTGATKIGQTMVDVNIGNAQTLSSPGTLTLSYDATTVPKGTTLGIFKDGAWTALPTTFQNGTASAKITASGTYALLAVPSGVPVFNSLPALMILLVGLSLIPIFRGKREG